MYRLLQFLYLNSKYISYSFIVLSAYRKIKRIKKRLTTFDKQDKLFIFFFVVNILIGFFCFCYLENPGLKIVDTYIVHTFFLTYFYILSKKIANMNYFPSIIFFLVCCPSAMFIVFGMINFFNNEDSIFEWINEGELSLLMQLIMKGLNLFFSFLENSNIAECQPPEPIKLPNIPDLPQPHPPVSYTSAVRDGFEHGCMGIGVTTALNFNPRTRIATGIAIGSISFLSHLFF
jgi:hypothetical protein